MCRVVLAVVCFLELGSVGLAATSFQNENPFASPAGDGSDARLIAPAFSATHSSEPLPSPPVTSAPQAPAAPVSLDIPADGPLASSALPSQTSLGNLSPVFVASAGARSSIPEIVSTPATPLASASADSGFSRLLTAAREYTFEIVLGIALLTGMAWLCYLSPLSVKKNHAG